MADWGRKARADVRCLREMPGERARSGLRVALSHDSIVTTYIQINIDTVSHPIISRQFFCVAGNRVWIERLDRK